MLKSDDFEMQSIHKTKIFINGRSRSLSLTTGYSVSRTYELCMYQAPNMPNANSFSTAFSQKVFCSFCALFSVQSIYVSIDKFITTAIFFHFLPTS